MPNNYTKEDILKEAKRQNINLDDIGYLQIKLGVKIEREHPQANTLPKIMLIVIQHLTEIPDYYTRLTEMENQAKLYWKGKHKPQVVKKM